MIKLIILDFDDTLTDNQILDYQSFKIISMKLQSYIPSKNDIKNLRKKNYDAIEIIDWIEKKSKINFDKEKFFIQRDQFLESKHSVDYLKLQPFSKNAIKKLKSKDLTLVISSLREKKSIIKYFLETKGIFQFIDKIVTVNDKRLDTRNETLGTKMKKQLFKKILKDFGKKQFETISIGDSISDYKAAKVCGIKHITFQPKNPYILKQKLGKQIHSFKNLPQLMDDSNNQEEFL